MSYIANGVLGNRLKPKAEAPSLSSSSTDRKQMLRQPITTWRTLYGEVLVSGPLTFIHQTDNNQYLNLLITLACHEVQEIGEVYFHDELIADASGTVIAKYSGYVEIYKGLGTTAGDSALHAALQTNAPGKWTSNHKQTGHAKLYVRIKKNADLFPSGVPGIRVLVKGKKVYDTRTAATIWTDNVALCQRDYSLNTEVGLGATAAEIDDTLVSAAANICEEQVAVVNASATFTADAATDRLTIAQVKGLRTGNGVQVSTSGTLPAGLAAVTTYYWIRVSDTTGKLATTYANALAGTAIDLTSAGSGTHTLTRKSEARYTCHGTVDSNTKPGDVLESIKAAMAGRFLYIGGKWKMYAGAYRTPTITLDEDDLDGPIRVQTRLSRRDMFNRVKGVYVDPDQSWQPTDFPAVVNATYLAEDNGEEIWKDLDYAFTISPSTAQRISKQELEAVRQQITTTWPCKLRAFRVQAGNVVNLKNTRMGWTGSGKPFEVANFSFAIRTDGDVPRLGVDLVLRETAAGVYDWNSGEETTVDLAPNTTLPDAFTVQPPGIPSIAESLYETTGSAGVKAKATASWAESPDMFVQQGGQYQLEYKLSSASTWTVQPRVKSTSDAIFDIAPGVYDFRVKAINSLGVSSAYVSATKEIYGLTAAPADVSGFYVVKVGGEARALWNLHDDLDVRLGGKIIVRHSPLTSGATWNDGVILDEFDGGAVSGSLPLITGTYMAKARDSSGNYSSNAVSFVATEGMVTGFTTVATSTQAAGFTGTKTNVAKVGSAIQLDGTTLIDSMATNIDDWPFIDSLGGISATGSYAFDTYLDMGTVATRRFEADLTALSFDTGDLIDSRTDLMDDWGLLDGNVIDDCDVTLYAATTDDDPAGSPTWGAWAPFMVADFTCRAAKFKLDFASGNPNHNIAVSQMTVHVKEPA